MALAMSACEWADSPMTRISGHRAQVAGGLDTTHPRKRPSMTTTSGRSRFANSSAMGPLVASCRDPTLVKTRRQPLAHGAMVVDQQDAPGGVSGRGLWRPRR